MRWQGLLFALGLTAVLAVHPAHAQVATVNSDCSNAMMQLQQGAPLIEDQKGHLCVDVTGGGSLTQSVNLAQVAGGTVDTGHGTAAGAQRVELPSDGTGVVGLNAGTNLIGKVGIDQTTPGTTNAVVATGNVAGGAADSGNPIKIGGIYNTTNPTYTNGQRTEMQMDNRGNILTSICGTSSTTCVGVTNNSTDGNGSSQGFNVRSFNYIFDGTNFDRVRSIQGVTGTGLGVTAVEQTGASYANITTATTTPVKSGSGVLHSIIINTPVASATITVYDNTAGSGTKIGTITLPSTITGESPFTLIENLWFTTGLTIVTSGATDLTVVYR